jgi:predicted AAA+ superfamily ATPase
MKNTTASKKIKEELLTRVLGVKTSLYTLFFYPAGDKLEIREVDNALFIKYYADLINAVYRELNDSEKAYSRLYFKEDNNPDSVDHLNNLIKKYGDAKLTDILITSLNNMILTDDLLNSDNKPAVKFFQAHCFRLLTEGITTVKDYIDFLDKTGSSKSDEHLKRMEPEEFSSFFNTSVSEEGLTPEKVIDFITEKASETDLLNYHRVFKFADNQLIPVNIAPVRKVEDFYGYPEAKNLFRQYFKNFAEGLQNLPLLLSSLPGLGKTHFTIAHALEHKNLKLVILSPEELEKPLQNLITCLSLKNKSRFVLFFDDVDTRKIDWYYFRTLIGGTYTLPENITIVIASNFEFPANISSRGRGFTFPVFDEIQCQKMVEDFLKRMGMKHPPSNLISVIAADYVEEFGQKKFEELSPRTLVRYLSDYYKDTKKRIKMLQLSREERVPKPDAQCFYETNKAIQARLKESI